MAQTHAQQCIWEGQGDRMIPHPQGGIALLSEVGVSNKAPGTAPRKLMLLPVPQQQWLEPVLLSQRQ